jgi:hypothetical protein
MHRTRRRRPDYRGPSRKGTVICPVQDCRQMHETSSLFITSLEPLWCTRVCLCACWNYARYDTFCPISSFIPKSKIPNPQDIELWLKVCDLCKCASANRLLEQSLQPRCCMQPCVSVLLSKVLFTLGRWCVEAKGQHCTHAE